MYSKLWLWTGRDSSRTMLRPWTAKMVRISCKEPLWWGTRKQVQILSRPCRSSIRVDTTTNRVVFSALLLISSARISKP